MGTGTAHGQVPIMKANASEHPLLWLGLWFVCNLLITLGTKGTFRTHGFIFPRTLTLVHMLFTSVLSNIAVYLGCNDNIAAQRERVISTPMSAMRIFVYSTIFACNIVLSNIALQFVSVSMHQVIRSLTPAITVLLGYPFGYTVSARRGLTLIPLWLGVSFAVFHADAQTSARGIALTLLSATVSAGKGIITKNFLVDPERPISPLGLIRLASPIAFMLMLPQALWNEGSMVAQFWRTRFADNTGRRVATDPLVLLLVASGVGAFFLNSLSFLASRSNTPLTMTVAGSAKQVTTIACGSFLFNTRLSLANSCGIALAICSTLAYSLSDTIGNKRQNQACKAPLSPPHKLQRQSCTPERHNEGCRPRLSDVPQMHQLPQLT